MFECLFATDEGFCKLREWDPVQRVPPRYRRVCNMRHNRKLPRILPLPFQLASLSQREGKGRGEGSLRM